MKQNVHIAALLIIGTIVTGGNMDFIKCPVCNGDKVIVIERGEAERDTLTKETWFISDTAYYCRCMNDDCVHETPETSTYEKAVELWNKGNVYKWEEQWFRRYHSTEKDFISDFY